MNETYLEVTFRHGRGLDQVNASAGERINPPVGPTVFGVL